MTKKNILFYILFHFCFAIIIEASCPSDKFMEKHVCYNCGVKDIKETSCKRYSKDATTKNTVFLGPRKVNYWKPWKHYYQKVWSQKENKYVCWAKEAFDGYECTGMWSAGCEHYGKRWINYNMI